MKYDRRELLISFFGVVVALIIAAENIYINYRVIGVIDWPSMATYWWLFIPLAVLFLIHQQKILYTVFAIYCLMAMYTGYLALKIYLDFLQPYRHLPKGIDFIQGVFVALVIILLVVDVIVRIFRWMIHRLKPGSTSKR